MNRFPLRRDSSLLAPVALPVVLLLAACGGGPKDAVDPTRGRGPLKFPVEVVTVETGTVEYTVEAVGSVEAFEQVAVTARVAGVVEKVLFQEGDEEVLGADLCVMLAHRDITRGGERFAGFDGQLVDLHDAVNVTTLTWRSMGPNEIGQLGTRAAATRYAERCAPGT